MSWKEPSCVETGAVDPLFMGVIGLFLGSFLGDLVLNPTSLECEIVA